MRHFKVHFDIHGSYYHSFLHIKEDSVRLGEAKAHGPGSRLEFVLNPSNKLYLGTNNYTSVCLLYMVLIEFNLK